MFGEYDVYILPAYGVTLGLLAALSAYSWLRYRKAAKQLAALQGKDSATNA